MTRKFIPAVLSCLFLSCCALFPQQPDVDLTGLPDENTPKMPPLKVKINTDYRFASFKQGQTNVLHSVTRRENAQTTKSAFYLKEHDFIKTTVAETLLEKDTGRTKGEIDFHYVVKTKAHCSSALTLTALATLYVAPLIGFPSGKACGSVQMTTVVKDVRGDLVKSYFVTKDRYVYSGPWYGNMFLTPDNDPLRTPLLNEALIETFDLLSKDAAFLTQRLNAVFAEKHPKKKEKSPKKRVFTDYY